jgi:HD-like signal output (HDOD) protein
LLVKKPPFSPLSSGTPATDLDELDMQAAQIDTNDLATTLREEISAGRVRLPTLPDVAVRIKAAAEGGCSAREIAALVAQDIALSGRLMQVANSPLYRGTVEIDSIQVAVTRLGTRLVRAFVIGLAFRQMFDASSAVLTKLFRDICQDAVQVAAICRVLADTSPDTDPEEAMLGGLLHNIGALPILARLDVAYADNIDSHFVHALVDELAPEIGSRILESWGLSEALVAVPEGCHALKRDSGPRIDYVDIVCAARLQYLFSEGLLDVTPEMSNLPALKKLGIQFETVVLEHGSAAVWAKQIRNTLDF